jgi:hypothetical protein
MAKFKIGLENFYLSIADEAEEGLQKNNLKPTYRALKQLRRGKK